MNNEGMVQMTSFMPAGEVRGNFFPSTLTSPETAEVHLVVQDHGPLNAERASEMLSTYREGCTDKSVPSFYPDTAREDGTAGPFACKVLQFGALIQDAATIERASCSPWPLCDWAFAAN